MNAAARLIVCLIILAGWGPASIDPTKAQAQPPDPRISLTVKNEPLSEALDAIADQTGYQFAITPQFEKQPVSAAINDLPLEQGLKRLLRTLNYTILWEADNTVVIKVYGKADQGGAGGSGSISYAAPPQNNLDQDEPAIEPDNEPIDENEEVIETGEDRQPESPDEPDRKDENVAEESAILRLPPVGSSEKE